MFVWGLTVVETATNNLRYCLFSAVWYVWILFYIVKRKSTLTHEVDISMLNVLFVYVNSLLTILNGIRNV